MIWEERWHPLREEWVVVAAHRQNRPWKGDKVAGDAENLPEYVEDCYLCPGNTRVSGQRNPDYQRIFVFDNDHPSVGMNAPSELEPPPGIYRNRPAHGIARVLCYSPKHNLTLAELSPADIEYLFTAWREQYLELGALKEINHVLIWENKGAVVGVSNPHPHCQIYATNFVWKNVDKYAEVSLRHKRETGRVLFQDILAAERADARRIVYENDTAIAFIPYFARYAYELYIAPKATHASLATMSEKEMADLSLALQRVEICYDNLWRMSFPYILSLHQAPTDGADYSGFFHFHMQFQPPLRKPNLLKYLAGSETGGGNFLSDTSPEEKAAELRAQPALHYKHAPKQAR
jgi:UDPglucose--hexose-1-phosphate uridylyltransferase